MSGFYVCNNHRCLHLFPRLPEDERAEWGRCGAWWPRDTPPGPVTPTTSHITHWKRRAADGADTPRVRQAREATATPGGRGQSRSAPAAVCCLFVRRAFSGVGTRNSEPCWASGPCSGKTEDAAGHPVSTQRHRLQASQTNGKPNPRRPRAHFLSAGDQLTSRSCPALGSRKDAARRPVGNVVQRGKDWFSGSGVRKRGRGPEEVEVSGCDLGRAGRARTLSSPPPH